MDYQFLGQFTQESNKMVISDPSYEIDDIGVVLLNNVKKGDWSTWATCCDDSCSRLISMYCDKFDFAQIAEYDDNQCQWKYIGKIFISTASYGMYDEKYYQDSNNIIDNNNLDSEYDNIWLDMVFNWDNEEAKIIPNGAVARTCADGCANVYCTYLNDTIIGISIVFNTNNKNIYLGRFKQKSEHIIVNNTHSKESKGVIIDNIQIGKWNTWISIDALWHRTSRYACRQMTALYCDTNIDVVEYNETDECPIYNWKSVGNIYIKEESGALIMDLETFRKNSSKNYKYIINCKEGSDIVLNGAVSCPAFLPGKNCDVSVLNNATNTKIIGVKIKYYDDYFDMAR